MEFVRVTTLLLAVFTSGLVTGVYLLYQHTIMPGLGKQDDRTFVAAFQALDRAIINPLFMFTFFGPFVFSLIAVITRFDWLVLIATVLNLAVVVITLRVNVPLNDGLKAAGDPASIDVKSARTTFNEAKWVRWNLVRSIASTVAFALSCYALSTV